MGRKHRHRRTPRQPRPLTEAALLKAAHRADRMATAPALPAP
ncbi:MAG: hypothetical protein AAFQ21_05665 [Pseudomonadota bacterium]